MHEKNDDKNVALNFLAGIGFGALIGAAAALLLAPKPGTETRQDIIHATEDFKGKADKVIHDLSESGEDLVKKSREILESTRDKVQQAIVAGKEAMAKTKEELAAEGEDIKA